MISRRAPAQLGLVLKLPPLMGSPLCVRSSEVVEGERAAAER